MRRKAGGAQIWPRTTPEQLMGISNVTAISIGGGHILMLKNVKTRGPLVTQQQRDDFVNALTAGTMSRGQVVRAVAENPIVGNREFNPAFVLMQYFGYLRRNPDSLPDTNFDGYQFWLNKLNQFGDFRNAEMVKPFILSGEYRRRFGP